MKQSKRRSRDSAVKDSPLSIQQMTDGKTRLEMGHLYITHALAGETVRVYTTDGKMVATYRITDNGNADIDLTTLSKGLYIVKMSKTSIKILNQ